MKAILKDSFNDAFDKKIWLIVIVYCRRFMTQHGLIAFSHFLINQNLFHSKQINAILHIPSAY